jgi:hypothetical protein
MKALGGGFKLAHQISFALTDPQQPLLIALPDDNPSNWILTEFPVSPAWIATLAVRQPFIKLSFKQHDLNQGDVT